MARSVRRSRCRHEGLVNPTFGRRQCEDAIGIRIVAERSRVRHLNTGAGEIDRGVEGVAAAPDSKAAVAPARHLDQDLADGENTGFLAAHVETLGGTQRNSGGQKHSPDGLANAATRMP